MMSAKLASLDLLKVKVIPPKFYQVTRIIL